MTTCEITKIVSDTFYITFLPAYDEKFTNAKTRRFDTEEYEKTRDAYISLITRYIIETEGGTQFDRLRFIHDARDFNKAQKEIYDSLLPPELLSASDDILNEIEYAYKRLQKDAQKGGYVRAVLEILHDLKYQAKFNELTDNILKELLNSKDNSIVLSFMDSALEQFSRESRESFYEYSWNYRKVTQIKAIGSTKDGETEKVNNPYSAYKVYAQGQYSKLLIGYESDRNKKIESLKHLLADGFNAIISDEKIRTYKSKDGEIFIIIPDSKIRDLLKKFSVSKPSDLKPSDLKIHDLLTKIIYLQMDAIEKILQRFNGYVPYRLSEVIDEIAEQCKQIYFKHYKDTDNFDSLDKYSKGNRYDETQCQFITRYFDYVMQGLTDDNREEFDRKTNYMFQTKCASIEDKLKALRTLLDSGNIDFHPCKDKIVRTQGTDEATDGKQTRPKTLRDIIDFLKDNKIWNEILELSVIEKAESLSSYEKTNKLEDDGVEIPDEDGDIPSEKTDKLNSAKSENFFSNSDSESENKIPEEVETAFEKTFPNAKIMPESMGHYFKRMLEIKSGLRKEHFGSLEVSMKRIFPEHKKTDKISQFLKAKEEKGSLSWAEAKQEFCPDDETKMKRLKLDFGFECLDKSRSYDGTWNRYKKIEQPGALGTKEIFRKKMQSVYNSVMGKDKDTEPIIKTSAKTGR